MPSSGIRIGIPVGLGGMREHGEPTVCVDEASQLEVDAEAACLFVTCTYDTAFMLDTQHRGATDSAHLSLHEGIVKLLTGMSPRHQDMATRGPYFSRLAQRLNDARRT